jgi:hypothetical protein
MSTYSQGTFKLKSKSISQCMDCGRFPSALDFLGT